MFDPGGLPFSVLIGLCTALRALFHVLFRHALPARDFIGPREEVVLEPLQQSVKLLDLLPLESHHILWDCGET